VAVKKLQAKVAFAEFGLVPIYLEAKSVIGPLEKIYRHFKEISVVIHHYKLADWVGRGSQGYP
jgi:hypothetical protein